ncbi:MAG: hypothetical protein EP347_08120 [Alphaproteobacteria bacterium]|nr:MAG: hypothetical protein EP347_08120 [Alphaproteobacteria bacterium]
MKDTTLSTGPNSWKWRLYQAFKYTVYLLLIINMISFFMESLEASRTTFKGGIPLSELMNVFTAALDSGAWIVLLLLFELETFVLPDEKIRGLLKWSLHAGRAICYIGVLWAFFGYWNMMERVYEFEPWTGAPPCEVMTENTALATYLDEYVPLTTDNCGDLVAGDIFYHAGFDAFADGETFSVVKRMAWTDVINSGVWILIVIVLELEVWLASSKLFGTRFYLSYKGAKLLLYGTLFVAGIYWWIFGEFLDFWDAFLWLVAFFFIEMNVIQWQEEVHEHALEEAGGAA